MTDLSIEELEAVIAASYTYLEEQPYGGEHDYGSTFGRTLQEALVKLTDQLEEALKRRSFNELRTLEELIDERYSD